MRLHLGHPNYVHKPANILCKSNTTIRNLFHYHLLDHVSPCLCPLFASTPSNQHGFDPQWTTLSPTEPVLAGGARFTRDIGVDYSKQTLASATDFIWRTFQQSNAAGRKNIQTVNLFIDVMGGDAYAINNEIHVSNDYMGNYSVLLAINAVSAVDYTVTNRASATAGGARFTRDIGVDHSKQTLASATDFIWRTFQQSNAADRKNVQTVNLFIDVMGGVAYATNNEIHVSNDYIGNYSGDVRREITGVLYHEMAHIWQWNGNGQTPGGLIEGIADFVRLKANYAPSHWVQAGQGDRWDQGYDVTAKFLDYCNGLRNGFVAELNKKMKTGYSAQYFVDLLGKTVDQLWKDYKAKYGQ
ncbi:plant basic secretory family protein [Populus alba x Populus x berolinensis]|uniref:Plant basic secretory family protein n=2 Tax=Populus TaxID=3689 RepID=A0A4U5QGK5_POPAL|nr:plant basic secretory family protein [Populus alba x Populus x berolinensis]TKS08137.1 plant basic secretory family protein [Populus alba]